jgi:hypothetical protein
MVSSQKNFSQIWFGLAGWQVAVAHGEACIRDHGGAAAVIPNLRTPRRGDDQCDVDGRRRRRRDDPERHHAVKEYQPLARQGSGAIGEELRPLSAKGLLLLVA